MKNLLLILYLVVPLLGLFDIVLVGKTTYADLRVGEFRRLELPFKFSQYHSISSGESEASISLPYPYKVCRVQQMRLHPNNTDFYPFQPQGTNLSQPNINQVYLSDMLIINDTLYASTNDSIRAIQFNSGNGSLGPLLNYWAFPKAVEGGRLGQGKSAVYFLSSTEVYLVAEHTLQTLEWDTHNLKVEALTITQDDLILVSVGTGGLLVFKVDNNTLLLVVTYDYSFFGEKVDLCDVEVIDTTVYVLDRLNGLWIIYLNTSNLFFSRSELTNFSQPHCSHLQVQIPYAYIVCAEVHQFPLLSATKRGKTINFPNFNVKGVIVVSDQTMILSGSNINYVYYQGSQIQYSYSSPIRKAIPIGDNKILMGKDEGIFVSMLSISEPMTICGLKRKGFLSDFEGQMSTTINIVAECNQEYFSTNNIPYSPQLENDTCLYHFPLSISFWVGEEIDYFYFTIGAGILGIVCLGVLVMWFVTSKKVEQLSGLLQYQTLVSRGPQPQFGEVEDDLQSNYEHMVDDQPSAPTVSLVKHVKM